MASAWANHLPVVTVPQGYGQTKHITLVVPYYENRVFLGDQMLHWSELIDGKGLPMRVIVVDDGSPTFPARNATPLFPNCVPLWMRLYRIEVDVPWNWLAARNIGAHVAEDGWLLLTDMDHVVPEETLRSLLCGHHDPSVVYVFSRVEHTGEPVTPHSASFFMTKAMFWRIGGYDETLSGHYGTDGEFRNRIKRHAPIHVLTDRLVRHEYVGDSSTTRYERKKFEDYEAVKRLIGARSADWSPKTLSFPYQEVTC